MIEIILTKNKITLIDDEDFDKVNKYKWLYKSDKGYAIHRIYIKGSGRKNQKQKTLLLHRYLLNFPKEQVDHINGNRLDNRKCNLRIVTAHQQSMNKGVAKNNTSGHKGISWCNERNKWLAYIYFNYKKIYLGFFNKIDNAIKARNIAEKQYFGNFCRT